MTGQDNHYRIVRYLKSPIIDLGGGASPSELAVKLPDGLLGIVKDRSIGTFCIDGLRDDIDIKRLMPLWGLLADGGCLISANRLPDAAMKELRRGARFQVIESEPFHVVKKLSGFGGELPYSKPSPLPGQKTVCLVRYGAYGDHVQMSVIIDHFKNEGWYVAYNTNHKGRDVFKGDPRIDEYIDHEDGVIPAERTKLDSYWNRLAKHYDKFISFAEVAEKTLLRVEGQEGYTDPQIKRHAECNVNYFDAHFVRAGLPEIKGRRPVIWLSEKEKDWAENEVQTARKKLGKSFIVLWNIMGSSFHKMYPWAYDVWYLCQHNQDDIGFITVSDAAGAFLEEKRFTNVFPRAGKYTMRQTMALHSAVDGVVTPETNSMNIGLAFPAPVITLLSHSSREQFPWREYDIPLSPGYKDCPCYPCHQLHHSRASCPRGVVNHDATRCADAIAPVEVYNALLRIRHGDNALIAS